MQTSGLSLTIDPRWIVAVPQNKDVRTEAALQLGETPSTIAATDWAALTDDVAMMLSRALQTGAWWTGIFLAQENDGEYLLARAVLDCETQEAPVDIIQMYEELIVIHRDDDYQAIISIIETPLGKAVSHRQVINLGEETVGEYRGYHIPVEGGLVRVQAFSSGVGWAEVWGSSLESMVLTVRWADDVPAGQIAMQMYAMSEAV
jgi:hypothetical protein